MQQYLSYIYRTGSPVIVYLHGLGLNKESGINLFLSPELSIYGILIPDLPGHGQSQIHQTLDKYNFRGIAECITALLIELEISNYILVVHSISSLLVPFLEKLRPPDYIIQLEGNVTNSDADWSQTLSNLDDYTLKQYSSKLSKTSSFVFESNINTSLLPILKIAYAKGFKDVDPIALRDLSNDALLITQMGLIVEFIECNKNKISYILGDNGKCSLETKKILEMNQIDTFVIENSGHYPHIENPSQVSTIIENVINKLKYKS